MATDTAILTATVPTAPAITIHDRRTDVTPTLQFRQMSMADTPAVSRVLAAYAPPARTCDFSIGGLFMWIDYFRYEIAVSHGTMWIRGLNEKDLSTTAFSLPVGALPLRTSLELLRRHCREAGIPCVLSAVPASELTRISEAAEITDLEPLDDWSDYLYELNAFATLSGKKMSKKRNHVNRFMTDNPGYRFEPLTARNIEDVREFFAGQSLDADKAVSADYERLQVLEVLRHPELYGFEGAVLSTPDGRVAAFTMGEVLGDTVYVHIEKMDHTVAGAGETVAHLYARMMAERYGETLRYINREEDAGDEGLRQAKLSWHPADILRKYNVTLKI